MRPKIVGPAIAAVAALSLAACATERPAAPLPPVATATPPAVHRPALPPIVASGFAALPGWAEDDHAAALAAFQHSCRTAGDPALAAVCRRATAMGPLDEREARRFLEANFRPEPMGGAG